jgi:signal peptidase I
VKIISKLWKNNRRFILFLFGMLFFRSAVADWYHVPTGSMVPTIEIGDRVWVNKLAYDQKIPFTEINLNRHNEPERGEVVVFFSDVSDKRLIKRVIGVPGDVVSMTNNQLLLNGSPVNLGVLDSSIDNRLSSQSDSALYLTETLPTASKPNRHSIRLQLDLFSQLASFSPQVVTEEHLWVMGDNRDKSADSRVIGLVPRSELIGRAETVVFSLDKNHYYLPRKSRFMKKL